MPTIEKLSALEILDSRGRPTVGVRCTLDGGASAWASVPSGASTGKAEAIELRDGDPARYGGLGCRRAVANVQGPIQSALAGLAFPDQHDLDEGLLALDGTPTKSRLGANTILAVSIAFARACAASEGIPLYRHFANLISLRHDNADEALIDHMKTIHAMAIAGGTAKTLRRLVDPASIGSDEEMTLEVKGRDMFSGFKRVTTVTFREIRSAIQVSRPRLPRLTVNLFSGGKHAGGQVPIQDVLVVPIGAKTIDESLATTYAVYQAAAKLCAKKYSTRTLVADEGGLAPPFPSADAMLQDAVAAIELAGFAPGRDVALAVDVASSHFYENGQYHLGDAPLTPGQMIDHLLGWLDRFPILSIEDGLAEDDWENWPRLREAVGKRATILGDDLLCTNPQRIRRAIDTGAANALLLKVNQIGTLTEAASALKLARSAGWSVTVSARSGETEDDWLADLAVGWSGDHIKIGSITRSERLAKYNRLLAIEAEGNAESPQMNTDGHR